MSVTSSTPVVGVFRDQSMAEQAVGALRNTGFEQKQIWYSTPGNSGSFFEDLKSLFTGTSTHGGKLADDLTTMGLSDEETRYYSDEYSHGNTILAVQAGGREQEALSILHQYGALNSQQVFNQATDSAPQPTGFTQQDSYGTLQPQPQFGTSAEQPFQDRGQTVITPEYETEPQANVAAPEQKADSQNVLPDATGNNASGWMPQSEAVAPEAHLATQVPQASVATPEYAAEDRSAQSDSSAPNRISEAQPQQAAAATPGDTDEFQQLQEQFQAAQQRLKEVKAQLQAAKEHETQLRTAREHEQQLQSTRQQLQDVQSELAAALAELQETQARLAQYE